MTRPGREGEETLLDGGRKKALRFFRIAQLFWQIIAVPPPPPDKPFPPLAAAFEIKAGMFHI